MGWLAAIRSRLFPSRHPGLDPDAFTEATAERLRAALPDALVQVSTRLALRIERDGGSCQLFLDNVHRAAAAVGNEDEREALVAAWCASMLEMPAGGSASADDVVPVLKAPDWFAALPRREDGTPVAHCTEPLNEHLVIIYAIDTPQNVAYVEASWFDEQGVPREGLRQRAVANLRGKLPGLEVQRGRGLNMVVAGGYYEASLLLFDEFWEREAGRFRGDPVVAVPARDVLVYGDSEDPRAVEDLRRHARDIHPDAAYALSPHLFRRLRDGRVLPFDA